ncbi:MAG: caspase family protein [Hyphomicrobiaceae bacterium]|nr:caspase family protein [Hyphomicrobiaceae bacterium]
MLARCLLINPSSLTRFIALTLSTFIALATAVISGSGGSNAQQLPPENRIALLIANAKYKDSIGPLVNPPRDVEALRASLEKIGFKVTIARDLGLVPMRRAVSEYAKRLKEAGPNTVGFFYYSGHGAAESELGPNYLIPVDAELATGDDLAIASERLESLVDALGNVSNNVMQFVIFDACRSVLRRPGRGGTKGFVPIDQRRGMVIMFSTAAREVAFDEWPKGSNQGPFAAKLAELIVTSPKREDGMITDLQNAVHGFTQGRQEPFVIRSSVRDFFFNPKAVSEGRSEPAAAAADQPIRTVSPLDDLRKVIESGAIDTAERDALMAILDRLRTKGIKKSPFTYFAPGDLVGGAGDGVKDMTDYAPHMVFPFDNAEAFVNSQIYGYGGAGYGGRGAPGGGQFDQRNYNYPWRDNFCEVRAFDLPACPSGKGHTGVDIRGGSIDPATGEVAPIKGSGRERVRIVAVEDGTIVTATKFVTIVLRSKDGMREWQYLNLCPDEVAVQQGQEVIAGTLLGPLGNCLNGQKNQTTYHLHFGLRLRDAGPGRIVSPYMTLVRAYERKYGPGTMVSESSPQQQQRADAAAATPQ